MTERKTEVLTEATHLEAAERERLRKAQWPTMTIEKKIDALDEKLEYEIERIYNYEFPLIDKEIYKTSLHANEVSVKAREHHDESVQTVRMAKRDMELTRDALEQSIQSKFEDTINRHIAQSSSEVVASALLQALKNTILKVRTATREELKTGDVLVIRQASAAEIREH
jgi:hypothetical protein